MGRDAFVAKVWEWKAESGGTIKSGSCARPGRILRLEPASALPWTRGLSAAVRRVFVTLHKQKLIYRDKRLVNWDPQFQTAISDLEVDQRDVPRAISGTSPIRWRTVSSGEIVIATTRPETILADTAVAVHPSDERYKSLIGKCVRLPIVGRPIPIIADEQADPEKGSGAVKITPAHDFNDFRVGQRHKLPMINILDPFARLNDEVPPAWIAAWTVSQPARRLVEEIEALGLMRAGSRPFVTACRTASAPAWWSSPI